MDYNLSEDWKFWYHSIKDNNWNKESYNDLIDINILFDYHLIENTFKQNHYQHGMFFLMKKDIFPNWEDPSNRTGGCMSFKVKSTNILNEWNELILRCLTKNIMSENNELINGISISPKREFNIVKVWFSENKEDIFKKNYNEYGNDFIITNSIYKKHSF